MPIIETDILAIEYEDSGPAAGSVVLLLHGWPDDRSTWDKVAPGLNSAGMRTIIPSLRGFSGTCFLTGDSARTGNSGRLAMDAIALMDALGIEYFDVAGHDWGSNITEALAVGWPDRVRRIAMMSTPPRVGGVAPSPLWHARLQWYHWFLATARGAIAIRADGKALARIMWESWSPEGWFAEADFERVSASFDNPDWAEVTLHSYRSRWGEADPDPSSAWLEDRVRITSAIVHPALYFQGDRDGVNPPEVSIGIDRKFSGRFDRILMFATGHFPTREAPTLVTAALIRHFQAQ